MKILYIISILLIFTAFAFADITDKTLTDTSTTKFGDAAVKPSKNVELIFSSTPTQYTGASSHINGRYKFATTEIDDIKRTECDSDPCAAGETTSVTAGTMPW